MTQYDRRRMSYASSFSHPVKRAIVAGVEWATAKRAIVSRVAEFEALGVPQGPGFWTQALRVMGISVLTPSEQVDHIPSCGPAVVVANHPHGLVDGMVLAELIARRRPDLRILARSLLANVDEYVAGHLIPVPFPHEPGASRKMVAMRRQALDHLVNGGIVAIFPAGVVATSATSFGPAVEAEWNPFTAKLIQSAGAQVVPAYFPGSNSRSYLVANRVSATLRQSLLLREVVHALDRPQRPIIGPPISAADIAGWSGDQRTKAAELRRITLDLKRS